MRRSALLARLLLTAGLMTLASGARAATTLDCSSLVGGSYVSDSSAPAFPWNPLYSEPLEMSASASGDDGAENFSLNLQASGLQITAFEVTPNGTVAAPLSLQGAPGAALLGEFVLRNLSGGDGTYELESYRTLQSGLIEGESDIASGGAAVRSGQLIVDSNGNGRPDLSERVPAGPVVVPVSYAGSVKVWVELQAPPAGQTELITLAAQGQCAGYGSFSRSVASLENNGGLDRDNIASYSGVSGLLSVGTSADRPLRSPGDRAEVTDFVLGLSSSAPVVTVSMTGGIRGEPVAGDAAGLATLGVQVQVWPEGRPVEAVTVDAQTLGPWLEARLAEAVSAGDSEFRWVTGVEALPAWVTGSELRLRVEVARAPVVHRFWNGSVLASVVKTTGACPAGPLSCGPQIPLGTSDVSLRSDQANLLETLACNLSGLAPLRLPLITETVTPGYELRRLALRAETGAGVPVSGQALYGTDLSGLSVAPPALQAGAKTLLAAWDSNSDGELTSADRLDAGHCLRLRMAGAFDRSDAGSVLPLLSPDLF